MYNGNDLQTAAAKEPVIIGGLRAFSSQVERQADNAKRLELIVDRLTGRLVENKGVPPPSDGSNGYLHLLERNISKYTDLNDFTNSLINQLEDLL